MLRLYRSLVRSKLDYGCIVYRCWIPYTTRDLDFVLEHFELQYASKIKSLPKHPAHNAVFDNKYMKLFEVRPNAIRTFGHRIKQFLTASNIELSDILETPSYFIVPPWCIKRPKIVLDLVHLKKDQTDASIYQQLFMEIRER